MENINVDSAGSEDLPTNIENYIKLSYKQQIELVLEQEKQKLKLYTDYIINSIPQHIRKLKIKDILDDQGTNILLSEEERNDVLNKLNEIINATSSKSMNEKRNELLTRENMKSLEIVNEDKEECSEGENRRTNYKRTRVKLLPIKNACYTIIRESGENNGGSNEEPNSEFDSHNVIDVISSFK